MINYTNKISVEDYSFLRKSVGWSEIEKSQAGIGISNSAFVIAAASGGKTVGMARVVSDGGYVALICDVIVMPDFQGKGIGKTMMRKVMDYIAGSIKEGQSVMVNLMAVKGRETFYNQFGFIDRPNNESGCGMTMWVKK